MRELGEFSNFADLLLSFFLLKAFYGVFELRVVGETGVLGDPVVVLEKVKFQADGRKGIKGGKYLSGEEPTSER